MKVESRGKYPGVKLHLEADECNVLLDEAAADWLACLDKEAPVANLARKMRKKILALQEENPNLLLERSKEEIAAILIKEAEKSRAQLDHLQATGGLSNLDQESLKKKLLSYTEK